MKYNHTLELLQTTISEIDVPHNFLMDELNKGEPDIYLCGKSATGKTTFLNALLNREKDELFTSADISTKTEFRFIYGKDPMYQIDDADKQFLPKTYVERKELFTRLNQEGSFCTITLPEKALNGRIIVDIPGIFDYTNNKYYIQKMENKADVVCFFTPCIGKISAQEYDLLKELSDADIPVVLIFTMGDMTDPDEGITRKTLPDYIQNRINENLSEIKIANHFIVSASDYYKGKDSHGIDNFLVHIQANNKRYFDNAKKSRLKRLLKFYIKYLDSKIEALEQDKEQVLYLIERENKLKHEEEIGNIENQNNAVIRSVSRELEGLKKQCKDYIFGHLLRSEIHGDKETVIDMREEAFYDFWNDFWNNMKDKHGDTLTPEPSRPHIPPSVFKGLTIDSEKIEELLDKLFKKKSEEDDENKDDKKHDKITIQDIIDIGINMQNASILFKKWTYYNSISIVIDGLKEDVLIKYDNLLKQQKINLHHQYEQKIKDAIEKNNTIQKLKIYQSAVNNLKAGKDYA